MTQEEKSLLLKDLCARLPYGVQCSCTWSHEVPNGTIGCIQELSTFLIDEIEIMDNPEYDCQICDVKPHLRPMSSITKEEKEEIKPLFSKFTDEFGKRVLVVRQNKMALYQDWLNSHHFDYRGLIEKGLALEAPKDMYTNN